MFKYFKFSIGLAVFICLICSVIIGVIDVWNKNYTVCGFIAVSLTTTTILMFSAYCLFYTLDCMTKFIKK
ncbi:MAG: hypothetical protein ACRDDY_03365 [Clostridium sp.]|uniref:hypothetical protein n=1 Tax=Clostridium sp. TaxID=1506 RepID=UPI003EE65122